SGVDPALVLIERIPRGDAGGARREFGAGWNDALRLLPREALLAHTIPALVELTAEFFDPRLRRVVRRMGGTRRVVDEKRLFRAQPLLLAHPVDGAVGHVAVE